MSIRPKKTSKIRKRRKARNSKSVKRNLRKSRLGGVRHSDPYKKDSSISVFEALTGKKLPDRLRFPRLVNRATVAVGNAATAVLHPARTDANEKGTELGTLPPWRPSKTSGGRKSKKSRKPKRSRKCRRSRRTKRTRYI